MKKIFSLIFSIILITTSFTACGENVSSESPTPTEEQTTPNTVSEYDPLQTPWRVPTYPPSPTATPTAMPEATLAPKSTPVPRDEASWYPYGIQQLPDYYYNVYFRKENESNYTRKPSYFTTESEFYDYLFDYSEKHVKEIIDNLSNADKFFMKVEMAFPNSNDEDDTLLNQKWGDDNTTYEYYFILEDKETLDTLKGILSRVKFERNKEYKYTESSGGIESSLLGGIYGPADIGDQFHIYYALDPGTLADSYYAWPIVRKGLGFDSNGNGHYRYGNSWGASIYGQTLKIVFSGNDQEVLTETLRKIEKKMKEKLVKILNSENSNPILDMS